MSKSILSNPKGALVFAGVVIALAMAGSFAAGSFVPQTDEPPPMVAEPEAMPGAYVEPEPEVTWADEGFSDDWNDPAPDTGFGGDMQTSDADQPGDYPVSEDFAPQTTQSSEPTYSASSQRPGAVIQVRPSPDAPPLNPPD